LEPERVRLVKKENFQDTEKREGKAPGEPGLLELGRSLFH